MKRFIYILIFALALFIGTATTSFAFEVGDILDGVTITETVSKISECDKYVVLDDTIYLLSSSNSAFYQVSENNFKIDTFYYYYKQSYSLFLSTGSLRKGIGKTNSAGGSTSLTGSLVASNFDIYDASGNLVFPPPPEVAPAPEVPQGIQAVTILPQAITGNLKILLPLGLALLAILFLMPLLQRFLRYFL